MCSLGSVHPAHATRMTMASCYMWSQLLAIFLHLCTTWLVHTVHDSEQPMLPALLDSHMHNNTGRQVEASFHLSMVKLSHLSS